MAIFWLPTRPYTLIDAVNRMAAATGSPRYAQGAAHADYNGHHVVMGFNDYRRHWVTHYMWSGPVYLGRGDFDDCLRAGIGEHNRGALGSQFVVTTCDVPDLTVDEQAAKCIAAGLQPWSEEIAKAHHATYQDDRWQELHGARDYERHGLAPAVGMLVNSTSRADYLAKLDQFFAERRAARARPASAAASR